MRISATYRGNDISTWGISADLWEELVQHSKIGGEEIRLRGCNHRAIPKRSSLGNLYFAHYPRDHERTCAPTSALHIDLQFAALTAIKAVGWAEEFEARAPDNSWRADALAIRGRAKVAFEIQLSGQGDAETRFRDARYSDYKVIPFWIAQPSTAPRGFTNTHHAILKSKTPTGRAVEANRIVTEFLKRLEDHVALVRDLKDAFAPLEPLGWELTTLHRQGEVGVVFRAKKGDLYQDIVIGELGRPALPDQPHIMFQKHGKQHCGAILQIVRSRPAIKGFYCKAFYSKQNRPIRELTNWLKLRLTGKIVWRGEDFKETVSGAFVGYSEDCRSCSTTFWRTPFAVVGHIEMLHGVPPRVEETWRYADPDWLNKVGRYVGRQLKVTVGIFRDRVGWSRHYEQHCPKCDAVAPSPLITRDDVALWPHDYVHFTSEVAAPGQGWTEVQPKAARRVPSVNAWNNLILRAKRDRAEAEEKKRIEEARLAKLAEEYRQQRATREAARIKAEEDAAALRKAEAERRQAEKQALLDAEHEAREAARKDAALEQLERRALERFKRKDAADLWMRSTQPRLNGRRPIEICVEADGLERCEALLRESK